MKEEVKELAKRKKRKSFTYRHNKNTATLIRYISFVLLVLFGFTLIDIAVEITATGFQPKRDISNFVFILCVFIIAFVLLIPEINRIKNKADKPKPLSKSKNIIPKARNTIPSRTFSKTVTETLYAIPSTDRNTEMQKLQENIKSLESRLESTQSELKDLREQTENNIQTKTERQVHFDTPVYAPQGVPADTKPDVGVTVKESEEARIAKYQLYLYELEQKRKVEQIVEENRYADFIQMRDEFVGRMAEYLNYYFSLEQMTVTIVNVYADDERRSVIAELDLGKGVYLGQIRYRLGSIADYLNVKSVKITNVVSDLSKAGLEIPYPNYLLSYFQ